MASFNCFAALGLTIYFYLNATLLLEKGKNCLVKIINKGGRVELKKTKGIIGILLLVIFLVACGGGKQIYKGSDKNKSTIKVGTSVMYEPLMSAVIDDFEKASDYKLEVIVFDDAIATNIALAEGNLDANFFQHDQYLAAFNESRGTNLVVYGERLITSEYGLYSKKVNNINELKDGFSVSLPNDASNRSIALRFQADLGFLKLREGVQLVGVFDIVENKRNIKFVEMDRLHLVTTLDEVDVSAMPAIYMFQSNEDPLDTIASGFDLSELALIIALKDEDKKTDWAEDLRQVLKTDKVKNFVKEYYRGAIIPLF